MPFSRRELSFLEGASLDAALRDIGVRLGNARASEVVEADIERTLVSAARAALPTDFRLLGLVVAWLEVHHKHVNVPKLLRLARADGRPLARAWWSAIGAWLARQDARWKTLTALHGGDPLDLDDPRSQPCSYGEWSPIRDLLEQRFAWLRSCCALDVRM